MKPLALRNYWTAIVCIIIYSKYCIDQALQALSLLACTSNNNNDN